MTSFEKFMNETKEVNRWFAVKVAITGAFLGALLTVGFMVASMGIWFTW